MLEKETLGLPWTGLKGGEERQGGRGGRGGGEERQGGRGGGGERQGGRVRVEGRKEGRKERRRKEGNSK